MAIVGYATVSTTDQKLEAQLDAVNKLEMDRIIKRRRAVLTATRGELAAMLQY